MTPDQSAWMKLVQETGFKGSPINLLLSMKVNEEWNWTHQAPGTMGSPVCPNTAYDMGTALRRNPFCRVLFFGGIHDAATPFWNVKHSISKMFWPESITSRIEYKVHENGPVSYTHLDVYKRQARQGVPLCGRRPGLMDNPVVIGACVALLVPFLGNTLGAALVFLMRHGLSLIHI